MSDTIPKEQDVRVLEFQLRRGQITAEQYQAYLESLPDCASEATETQVRFEARFARSAEDQD